LGNAHLFVVTRAAEPQFLVVRVALRVVPLHHVGRALAAPAGAAHVVGGRPL
jgi:hypothetical protein